jgi:hypothetical protein
MLGTLALALFGSPGMTTLNPIPTISLYWRRSQPSARRPDATARPGTWCVDEAPTLIGPYISTAAGPYLCDRRLIRTAANKLVSTA